MSSDTDKKVLPIPREEIVEAIARGWCAPECSDIEMDNRLTSAIVREIESMLAVRLGAAPADGTEKDAERLDFMIAEECQIEHMDRVGAEPVYRVRWPWTYEQQREWSASGREAIDAAIEAHNSRSPSCGP
jgi:hypothetical protein